MSVPLPAGLSTAKPVATARMLRKGGVDVINIADGPRATVRMSNSALAEAIQREVNHPLGGKGSSAR